MSYSSEYELPLSAGVEYEISGDDPVELLRKAAAAAQKAAALTAQLTAADLENEKTALAGSYAQANRGAENAYLKAVNPYGVAGQAMRSAGLDAGGWAESSRVGQSAAYQNALAANYSGYARQLGDLNAAIIKARQTGDIEALGQAGDYAVKLANQIYKQNLDASEAAVAQQNYEYKLARDAASDARYAEQTAYERKREELETEYKKQRDAVSDARYAAGQNYKTSAAAQSVGGADSAQKSSAEKTDEKKNASSGLADDPGNLLISDIPAVGVGSASGVFTSAAKRVISRLLSRYYGAPTDRQIADEIGRAADLEPGDIELILARFGKRQVEIAKR